MNYKFIIYNPAQVPIFTKTFLQKKPFNISDKLKKKFIMTMLKGFIMLQAFFILVNDTTLAPVSQPISELYRSANNFSFDKN